MVRDDAKYYAGSGWNSPFTRCFSITPQDDKELNHLPRALFIGGAGNMMLVAENDDDPVTFIGLKKGDVLTVRAKKILATGTTATQLIGMY
ncbi:hypothetical protein LCGC14_2665100 [marine sediment metagenome]|uniref:Uncharacterized protein n=1 Tax=marine sediment metagenome TaxID=412755 RepID=A0A0F9C0X6_9ZZZZ